MVNVNKIYETIHDSGQPAILTGTSPLTSMLHVKLSPRFGNYDPVALNECDELIPVKDLTNLDLVIELCGELYAFINQKNADMFMRNPQNYSYPGSLRYPPDEVPTRVCLNAEEMRVLESHWGFMDFDPVFYVEGNFQ